MLRPTTRQRGNACGRFARLTGAEQRLTARIERWPIARPFRISRGAKTVAEVVVATARQGAFQGRGECAPYARYGESAAEVVNAIAGYRGPWCRQRLQTELPPGAARNAIDCALWDLECKRAGQSAWRRAGVPEPRNVPTAYTLSLGPPAAMARQAAAEARRPLLKLKLGAADVEEDVERLRAVRRHAPKARLIVDANEGWNIAELERFLAPAVDNGVELIEQPLPASDDDALAHARLPIAIAADESAQGDMDIAALAPRYQVVNLKLDKAGGLTRALACAREARALGLDVMAGCMVCTSLAVAPALLLTGFANTVDLDGPLLLARDRSPGLRYQGHRVSFAAAVWG